MVRVNHWLANCAVIQAFRNAPKDMLRNMAKQLECQSINSKDSKHTSTEIAMMKPFTRTGMNNLTYKLWHWNWSTEQTVKQVSNNVLIKVKLSRQRHCRGTHSTHCCAWPAEGRSVLHIERSWPAIQAAPTDRPTSLQGHRTKLKRKEKQNDRIADSS